MISAAAKNRSDKASARESASPASASWLVAISGIRATRPNSATISAAPIRSNRVPRFASAACQARIFATHRRIAIPRHPADPHKAVVQASTGVRTVTKGAVG